MNPRKIDFLKGRLNFGILSETMLNAEAKKAIRTLVFTWAGVQLRASSSTVQHRFPRIKRKSMDCRNGLQEDIHEENQLGGS